MRKNGYLIFGGLCLALILSFVTYPSSKTRYVDFANYQEEWEDIDSLFRLRQTVTALKKVDVVFQRAKKEKNDPQQYKSLMYKAKLYAYKNEGIGVKVLSEFRSEAEKAEGPLKFLLQSILAELHTDFYRENRREILGRSSVGGVENNDLLTWDTKRHLIEIQKYYLLSIQDSKETKGISLNSYQQIIERPSNEELVKSVVYLPTLYDFLVHRAMIFYTSNDLELTQSSYYFELDDPLALGDIDTFLRLKFETKDSTSSKLQALNLFKELLVFHQNDIDKTAFLSVAIRRVEFVYQNASFDNKDELYLRELSRLSEKYERSTQVSQANYLKAKYSYQKGLTYRQTKIDTFRWLFNDALEICQNVIAKKDSTIGYYNCLELKKQILQKKMSIKVGDYLVPHQDFKILANHTNVDKVFGRIIKTSKEEYKHLSGNKNKSWFTTEEYIDFYKEKIGHDDFDFDLFIEGDFQNQSTELIMEGLESGVYVLLMGVTSDMDYGKGGVYIQKIEVTSLSYFSRKKKGGFELVVTDRKTGEPLKGVGVDSYIERYDRQQKGKLRENQQKTTTDKNGRAFVKAGGNNYVFFELSKGKEKLAGTSSFYRLIDKEEKYKEQTYFFTDRAIYRPGQAVHFKGILMGSKGNNHQVVAEQLQKVVLIDRNGQTLNSLQLTTNTFGSFTGSFVIPQGLITGRFEIKNASGSVYFNVEEYKRPKFEVVINQQTKAYQLNDSVMVNGQVKALAGSNITGGKIVYRVVRKPKVSRRSWQPNISSTREIAHGVLETDAMGGFEFSFISLPDNSYLNKTNPSFTYEINIDVTDVTGETRSTSSSITIGYTSLVLGLAIPNKIDKNFGSSFDLITNDLDGLFIPIEGEVSIVKLKKPEIPFTSSLWSFPDNVTISENSYRDRFPLSPYGNEERFEHWEIDKEVFSETFNTRERRDVSLAVMNTWDQGVYQVIVKTEDSYGNEIVNKQYVTLFDCTVNELPYPSQEWFVALQDEVEPEQVASFLIGSSLKQKVLVEVEHGGEILKSYWLSINKEQRQIDFPVLETYRGGFVVHFTYIKENRLHKITESVTVPFTNKQLSIHFETFRDKLSPGQQEEWRLKIEGLKGDSLASEFVATLYDASLEQFVKHRFGLNLYKSYVPLRFWEESLIVNPKRLKGVVSFWDIHSSYYEYKFVSLNKFNFPASSFRIKNRHTRYHSVARGETQPLYDNDSFILRKANVRELVRVEEVERGNNEKISIKDSDSKRNTDPVFSPRTNFKETAFFYPQLVTDETGAVIVSFTMPEALTRWKMLGLAHTKDLKVGTIEAELVTQKELMITANPPRFFREGDRVFFTGKVANLSKKELNGIAKLEMFDALTMKPIDRELEISKSSQMFTVYKEGNKALIWELKIPKSIQAITYRISVEAGNHTDGEGMTVPVLSNRMLVTESLVLPIQGNEKKIFTFDKLLKSGNSSTLQSHKLTLEFTSNPSWYAIQSLPYLIEYPYECSEQIFSRFYANSVADHILNSNPKIQHVIEQWQNQTPEALLSNLEKNQELKSILLEETPWLRDAKGEPERKRRIGLLFDLNRMVNEQTTTIERLKKTQTNSGGWPWFKGMIADRYITQHILTGFGKLNRLNMLGDENKDSYNKSILITRKALAYADNLITEDYERLKGLGKQGLTDLQRDHLGPIQIQYLYMRSFYSNDRIQKEDREAYDYYLNQVKLYWNVKNSYLQGMLALVLHRSGEEQESKLIVRSFRENAIHSEELGVFWKTVDGHYWYQFPLETQAMMAEVFKEVAQDDKILEGIQTWLIRNKQANDWGTTKATFEASYVFLMGGSNWIDNDEQVQITLAGKDIEPNKLEGVRVEAGSGYFKTSWSGVEVDPEMGKVTVKKNTKGIGYGALYWQYFEQLDKITTSETPLKLKKKLFLEKKTDEGLALEPIDLNIQLMPGDRVIVRIELIVDRSMDYIHLKDMRASGLEPENVLSKYKYHDGLAYYQSIKDASVNFFIAHLPKGTFVFEYPLRVTHSGDFSNGITTIQSMYAPEFSSHSNGIRLKVK
jgi:hypothetical protein